MLECLSIFDYFFQSEFVDGSLVLGFGHEAFCKIFVTRQRYPYSRTLTTH